MKIFTYFIVGFFLVALGGLFLNSGISARNERYINEVVLAEKGENTLENNQNPLFVERMFALNNLIYNETIVGTINYSNTVTINNEPVDINISIDIYQTMPLMFDDKLKYFFHGVVNEFKSSIEDNPNIRIYGYYERNVTAYDNYIYYNVENPNFPLFGLNNTITRNEVNLLETAVFTYKNVELFELVITKSRNLEFTYYLENMVNYPTDINAFYNKANEVLTVRSGGFQIPNEDQLLELNSHNYNFHIFKNQGKYNYLIFIYLAIYFVIVALVVYFVFIRKRIKKNI